MNRRIRNRLCLLCALSLALPALTGCGSARESAAPSAAATLPPAQSAAAAPVGDAALAYAGNAVLYLPSLDGQKLLAQYAQVDLSYGRNGAENVVRALLAFARNDQVTDVGDGVQLQLTGQNPVEVAGGVCTVNLASSALQLDHQALYTVCLSLATTLCQLADIHYVNVLIAGQAVGLDITGNLPAGSMTARPGEELPVLWEQTEARKTPLGDDPSTVPLTGAATLYFPLADKSGVIPETRNLSFTGQSPQQLASGLLNALSAGAQYLSGVCAMPDLNSLMLYSPQVADLQDTGGRLVTLNFVSNLDDRLREEGVDTACLIAAVVDTLTTFIPSVTAVSCTVGDIRLTSLYNERLGATAFTGGMMKRADFSAYLMGQATLYFPAGDALKPVLRSMPFYETASPRYLLGLLMAGPTEAERAEGLADALPAGLGDADIIGVAIDGDTLLLNLSGRFADAVRQAGEQGEQTLCYSMVNTLCEAKGLRRMRFFFGGEGAETLGGLLYWGGEFQLCPGLIDRPLG